MYNVCNAPMDHHTLFWQICAPTSNGDSYSFTTELKGAYRQTYECVSE